MAVDGSLIFDTKIDTKGFKSGTNTIKTQANGLKSTLLGLGKTLGVAFGVTQLIKFGKQAIDAASDIREVQNVVDTAFGSMSYKMEEFAKTSIESFGLSKLAAKQNGSTFMSMAKNMISSQKAASDMAITLTGLTGDWASFYNVSTGEAATALNGIFTGETEVLKRYGYVMTEANLQAFAFEKGSKKQISAMTQEEKVMLRYNYIMEKSAMVQGDFAKTSDSWANQTRVLSEHFKELLGILGQGLIHALTPVVRFLNTALSYLITFANTVGKVLSSVFNLSGSTADTAKNTTAIAAGSEDASDGLADMGKAAKKAGKDAKSGTAGFDVLNNMTESMAKNTESAADGLAMMGGGGGSYGMEINPTVNPADTSALESGLASTISNIRTGLNMFLNYIKTSFGPIFSTIWTNLQVPIQNFKTILSGIFADMQTLAQPLIDYFTGTLIPAMQEQFTILGNIVVGLFDTFDKVFSDIWDLAVFPLIQNFITVLLPMFTDIGLKVSETLGVLFEEVKRVFDMLWTDAIAPALGLIVSMWTDFINVLKDFWDKWGSPIFEGIKTAIQTTADLFVSLWNSFLKPIWDKIMEVVNKLWTEHLKPLLANIMDFVGELVTAALDIYNKFIAPVVKWFVEKFGPPIAKVINFILDTIGNMLGGIIDAVSGIITALKGVVQFIAGVFTGDWKRAWTGIKNIFKGVWDALVGIVKTPINLIIDLVNGLLSGITKGINAAIKGINKISFDVPDWVPKIGGKSFGFNISTLTAPKIPRLATGTVVPANYGEFLAVLGDNKREAEVVSPISAMKQAFKEAIVEMRGAGTDGMIHVTITLPNGKVLFDAVVEADKQYKKATGKSAFAY